jgi:hypothetical protein
MALESGYSILATLEGKLSNSGSAMKKVLEWVIFKYEILSRVDWWCRLSIGLRLRFALHGTSSPQILRAGTKKKKFPAPSYRSKGAVYFFY